VDIFWIKLDVCFDEAMQIFDKDNIATGSIAEGFIQDIGCTFNDEKEMKSSIWNYLQKQKWLDITKIKISFDVSIISENEIEKEIYDDADIKDSLCGDPLQEGFWYFSGKGFYYDDEKSSTEVYYS
jgi:hypothetical protein